MRRPIRKLGIAIFVFLFGVTGLLLSLSIPAEGMSLSLHEMLEAVAGASAALGFVAALILGIYVHGFTRLRSGVGVIARWVIPPAQWEQCRRRSDFSGPNITPRNPGNVLDGPQHDDTEVIVSGDAVCVGSDFFHVPISARALIRGAFLEFDQFIFSRFGGYHDVLRVPIAPGSEPAAMQVIEKRRAAYPVAVRRFRRKCIAALIVLLLITSAWLFAFSSGL